MQRFALFFFILLTFVALQGSTFFTRPVYAQPINNGGGGVINNGGGGSGQSTSGGAASVEYLKNPIKVNSIIDFIKAIIDALIKIAIPIIALAIIYSGFLFVSARGNTEKLEAAKRTFIYTLLGAAILLGAWALAQIISETVSAITA